jgi:nucleoside-diphosphate-sugar epimerase
MRLLVTGASGFVGINLVREIASRGVNVVACTIGEPTPAGLDFVGEYSSIVDWVSLDVRDKNQVGHVFRTTEIDAVIHGAAVTSASPDGPSSVEELLSTNVMGTVNVLEAARAIERVQVVYLSSGAVYGSQDPTLSVIGEDHELSGANPYAVSKILAEQFCRAYAGRLSVAICRLGTLYGPMEIANPHRPVLSLPCKLVNLAQCRRSIRVFGLSRRRSFCYVGDAARAVADLAMLPDCPSDTFNVGAPEWVAFGDLLDIMSRIRSNFTFEEVDDPEDADLAMVSADERPVLDTARLESHLGPIVWCGMENGIKQYLDWLVEISATEGH